VALVELAIAQGTPVSEGEAVALADRHVQQQSPTYKCRITEPEQPSIKAAGVSVPIETADAKAGENYVLLCMPPLTPGVRGHALLVQVGKLSKEARIVGLR
jgi:hypothetical protein